MKLKTKCMAFFIAFTLLLGLAPQPLFAGCPLTVEAHSGRTDAYGGHRDNQNASGLGYYHYHCGGHPAHLHPNGVCPYSGSASSGSTSSSSTSSGSTGSGSTNSSSPSVSRPAAKLNRKRVTLSVGKRSKLRLKNAKGTVKWASGNKRIASVSSNGTVSAKRAGTCVITARYNGRNYRCRIIVKNPFRLKTSDITIQTGQQKTLKANVKASSITWRSGKKDVVSVSKSGVITGKAKGRCFVYATYMGKTQKCRVIVQAPPETSAPTVS